MRYAGVDLFVAGISYMAYLARSELVQTVHASSLSFVSLTLALYYARSRRILPANVAHGFVDIRALIWLW